MKKQKNIERNKLDYILTDAMPVEISELFSYGEFYKFLLGKKKILDAINADIKKLKGKGEALFKCGWASVPLKYNIMKGSNNIREISLLQPLSVLNVYLFIENFQKEILNIFDQNESFSLRYHKKSNNLYYKIKVKKNIEYIGSLPTYKESDKYMIQRTGCYFDIKKFNNYSTFLNSNLWEEANFKFKYFAKLDYQECFKSIYSHAYKWIIEGNTVDSKKANNSTLYIVIDRILQNINGHSSNGVVVGPEFSRMIAEILLQAIDVELKYKLLIKGIMKGKDYALYRYVDDIFLFSNNPQIIDTTIETLKLTAQKYLLKLNEFKEYKSETPVALSDWVSMAREYSDFIGKLFYDVKEIKKEDNEACLIKEHRINVERYKNAFLNILNKYQQDKPRIVAFALTTFLNNIGNINKCKTAKLFRKGKEKRAFEILDIILFIYSFYPNFSETQKVISILVYIDCELKFNTNEDQDYYNKLVSIIRKYSFVFENANLNDICNWFPLLNQYKLSFLPNTEKKVFARVKEENNPIIYANYLIYSTYNEEYQKDVAKYVESIISSNIKSLHANNVLLMKEFWYCLTFCNCPYISSETKNNIWSILDKIYVSNPQHSNQKCLNLIYEFLKLEDKNRFFNWNGGNFNLGKQITYRTLQRTVFNKKNYKNINGGSMEIL